MENAFLVETILKWLNNPNENPSKISAIFWTIRYNDCTVQGLAGTTARPMAKSAKTVLNQRSRINTFGRFKIQVLHLAKVSNMESVLFYYIYLVFIYLRSQHKRDQDEFTKIFYSISENLP